MCYNYSIIIPHHNIPRLLCRCLSSIPRRKDIQIIVVDDNSSTDIVDFNTFPGLDDPLVEVYFTKEGKGAGYARNIGLQHAKGKWLLFADADDYFLDNAFELCDKHLNSNYDIVYFCADSVNSDTGERVDRYKIYNKYIDACDNVSSKVINMLKFRHDVPWGKMIRHSLVVDNRLKFGETRFCNDTLFSTLIALKATLIYAEKTQLYCVTERIGSLITSTTLDAYYIRYEVILKKNKLLRENGFLEYQLPIGNYVKKICKFGLFPALKAIKMGVDYRVNFFLEYKRWLKRSSYEY